MAGFFTRLHADQLTLEFRVHLAHADIDGEILVFDLLHRVSLMKALVIDNHDIIHGHRPVLDRFQGRHIVLDSGQFEVDGRIVDTGVDVLDLEPLVFTKLEIGSDIDPGDIGKTTVIVE
jgi:hypothetical protein